MVPTAGLKTTIILIARAFNPQTFQLLRIMQSVSSGILTTEGFKIVESASLLNEEKTFYAKVSCPLITPISSTHQKSIVGTYNTKTFLRRKIYFYNKKHFIF